MTSGTSRDVDFWLVVTGTWRESNSPVGNVIIPMDEYFLEGVFNHQPEE